MVVEATAGTALNCRVVRQRQIREQLLPATLRVRIPMKLPSEVFFEIYQEARESQSHDIAVVEALAAVLFDLQARGMRQYSELGVRFKLAANARKSERVPFSVLRERLHQEWTDWSLTNR